MAAILQLVHLCKRFGGLKAVCDLDLSVERGTIAGLIGPNGAGKTTVFNLIAGNTPPTSGDLLFDGASVRGLKSFQRCRLGIARTFQNIRLFNQQSVLDNVKTACHTRLDYGLAAAVSRSGSYRRDERNIERTALELLEVFGMCGRCDDLACNLPYGEQRKLEIVRALATQPQLLLLDEPAAGMNPQEIQRLMELVRFIKQRFELTVLLIEHQMKMVMALCDYLTVMDFGEKIAEGVPAEIRTDPRVIEAYLGKD